jgi:hypothetical protein
MITAHARPVIVSTEMLQEQILRCCCVSESAANPSAAVSAAAQPDSTTPVTQAVLNISQRMRRLEGTRGGVQIVVTVINSGAQTAEDVVVTVSVSPVLPQARYKLKADTEWQTATLAKLESAPVALQPGKARTFSLQITPARKSAAVSVTSMASAVAADPAISTAAGTLTVSIGG